MIMYKALIKDRETKQLSMVEFEQNSLKAFNNDIIKNGYIVKRSCTKDKYDLILNYTSCEDYLFSCSIKDLYRLANNEITELDLFNIYTDKKLERLDNKLKKLGMEI